MGVTIHIDSLTFGYRRAPLIFKNLTTSVIPTFTSSGRGFITVVMGESGSGKTTMLKLLLGEEIPIQGSISITPADIGIAYLSQDPILFEHLSVAENARYFSRLRSKRAQFDEATFLRTSQKLGLSEIIKRPSSITGLSGGERQRIALLRALSIRPSLLLLDEPCRGMDNSVRQEFLLYLRQLTDELGLGVVYVTHQHNEARLLADRILFLVRPPSTKTVRVVEGSLSDFISLPQYESIALAFSKSPMNRAPARLLST
jgi:iron(III) transport system ATP-binding protein